MQKSLLIESVLKNGSITENKKTDSDFWKKKTEAWNRIDQLMVAYSDKFDYNINK